MAEHLTHQMLDLIANKTIERPPPGATVDVHDRPKGGIRGVTAVTAICIALMVIFATIRMYARAVVLRKWTAQDYAFSLAFTATTLYASLTIVWAESGPMGTPAWDVQYKDYTEAFLLSSYLSGFIGHVAHLGVMLTLFCVVFDLFRQMFWIRILAIAGAGFSTPFYLTLAFVRAITCRPLGGTDRLALVKGLMSPTCHSTSEALQLPIAVRSVTTVLDFFILGISLAGVWVKLRQPSGRKPDISKAGVVCLFLAGLLVCVMGLVAIVFRMPRFAADWVALVVAAMIEITVSVAIPCIVSLAQAIQQHRCGHLRKNRPAVYSTESEVELKEAWTCEVANSRLQSERKLKWNA